MYATPKKQATTKSTTATPSKQTYHTPPMSSSYYSDFTPTNLPDDYYVRTSMSAPPAMGAFASGNIPIIYESHPSPTRGSRNKG